MLGFKIWLMEVDDEGLRDLYGVLGTVDTFFSDRSAFNAVRYRAIVKKDKVAEEEYRKHLKVMRGNAKWLHKKLNEMSPDQVESIIRNWGRPSSNENISIILNAIYKGFADLDALCKQFCKLRYDI